METAQRENVGTLVGWTEELRGNRLILKVQTINKRPPFEPQDIREFYVLMNRTQAIQLGHSLFEITDQTKPPSAHRKKRLLDRLLGA